MRRVGHGIRVLEEPPVLEADLVVEPRRKHGRLLDLEREVVTPVDGSLLGQPQLAHVLVLSAPIPELVAHVQVVVVRQLQCSAGRIPPFGLRPDHGVVDQTRRRQGAQGLPGFGVVVPDAERHGQPVPDDGPADVADEVPLLIGRAEPGEGVPRIQRLVREVERQIAVDTADAAARDHFGAAPGLVALLRGERVLVDSDLLYFVPVRHPAAAETVDDEAAASAAPAADVEAAGAVGVGVFGAGGAPEIGQVFAKLGLVLGQVGIELREFRVGRRADQARALGRVQELERGQEKLFLQGGDLRSDRPAVSSLGGQQVVQNADVRIVDGADLRLLVERHRGHADLGQRALQSLDAFVEKNSPDFVRFEDRGALGERGQRHRQTAHEHDQRVPIHDSPATSDARPRRFNAATATSV